MRIALALALVLSTTACIDTEEPEQPLDPDTSLGAFELGTAWPDDDLVVCWMPDVYDSTDGEVQALLPYAEQLVLHEWGRVGRIRFNNLWGNCKFQPDADIRIGLQSGAGGRSELGTRAQAIAPGLPTMTLGFSAPSGGCVPGGPGDACARTSAGASLTAAETQYFAWVVLHEFGHALGLRHEHARDDSTCASPETLDSPGYNGEPLWTFDASSVMSYCYDWGTSDPVLSAGDIRALHTIYPGAVALFADTNFGAISSGSGTWIGAGYYTTATLPALATTSSFVVPAGVTVTACTSSSCGVFTTSRRTLTATFDNHLQNIAVAPAVVLARDVGFGGIVAQLPTGLSHPSGLGAVGDNQASSVFVPPTRQATACSNDNATGTCITAIGGGLPTAIKFPALLDNAVSSVNVVPMVETYSDAQFRGARHALGVGTYTVSAGSTWLTTVRALAVSGLRVVACTAEGTGPLGGGAGTCATYEQSAIPSANGITQIRYLEISTAPIVHK